MADDSVPRPIMSRKMARDAGLKGYFTGAPCGRGHLADRATANGDCTECRDARVRAWNEVNKDRRYDIRQKWRAENKDKERASQRAWTERNQDFVRTYGAAYYRANKDRHQEQMRKWKADHPIEQTIYSQNTRARRLGILGRGLSISNYHAMLTDQCGHCAYCGEARNLVIDHAIPFARGGAHEPENCVLCCTKCNRMKAVERVDAFVAFLATQRPGLWTATARDVWHLLDAPWRREGS